MSGMQDVATLAEKYNNLSVSSQKLHATITRMKKEVGLLTVSIYFRHGYLGLGFTYSDCHSYNGAGKNP